MAYKIKQKKLKEKKSQIKNPYNLPQKVLIPKEVLEEDIADYLSDNYGFCVNSFHLEKKKGKVYTNKIDWDITE
jgi:hypothetical protein